MLKWLKRLLSDSGKRGAENRTPAAVALGEGHDLGAQLAAWMSADCPFCDARHVKYDRAASRPYPVWICPCGAIGSGAWLPDLDEVSDQLLQILGLDERVSEPIYPVDPPNPYVLIQRYDANQVEHDMTRIMNAHGYVLRVTERQTKTGNERLLWIKSANPKCED